MNFRLINRLKLSFVLGEVQIFLEINTVPFFALLFLGKQKK